ncbi:MAG: hypothetical protein IJ242_00335 [Clostridia bacterium]|nr:hypothetical protein [Clostridia bacterium]
MSLKEMALHLVLVCQTMTTAIDLAPKARLCHKRRWPSISCWFVKS